MRSLGNTILKTNANRKQHASNVTNYILESVNVSAYRQLLDYSNCFRKIKKNYKRMPIENNMLQLSLITFENQLMLVHIGNC